MVADISTGDPMKPVCLNCARRTVAPRSVSKYDGLKGYLKFRGSFTSLVKLPFAKMDGIIGDNLPMSAYKQEAWWSNSASNIHARGWLEAGWEVQEVNLKEAYVVFKKVRNVPLRKSTSEIKKPFTPVRVRPARRKEPSKTKVSKLYARIKNLERQRTAMPTYRGSFKPKPKHEKSLFRSDEKRQ
jgi:hypothetical protein